MERDLPERIRPSVRDRGPVLLADPGVDDAPVHPEPVRGPGPDPALHVFPDAEVGLRPATEADCALTLKWANDPQVRAASFSVEPISEEEHHAWFARSLAGARTLYIAQWRGIPIGLARLDPLPDQGAEVGLTVAAEHRGRGFAVPMLDALGAAAAASGVRRLVARIRVDNPRSRRAFERAGFRSDGSDAVNGVPGVRFVRELERTSQESTG